MALSDVAVLDLLLTARYAGGSAFGALNRDVDALVANTDRASKGLNSFKVAADAARLAGDTLITAAVGIGAAFVYSITEAAKFDQVKSHIEAVTGATKAQTQAIQDQTLAASKLYGLDPTQMLQGTYNILSSGVPVPQFLAGDMSRSFAAAYKARSEANQGQDYGSFVMDMTHAAQSGGLSPKDYSQFLGLTTFVENHSNLTTSSIADFLGRASPVLTQYGVSMRDQLLAAGTLGNMGFMGSAPGREFASGIQQLLSKSGQGELSKLGISPGSLYDKSGHLQTPEAIAQLIAGRTAGMSPAARNTAYNALFGRVGERVWLPFMSGAGQQKYGQLAGQMPGSAQAVTSMLQLAGTLSNTVQGKFQSILSTLKSIGIVIGQQIAPAIKGWETSIQKVLDKLQTFLAGHPDFAPKLLKALPGIAGSGLALKGAAPVLDWLGGATKVGGKETTHAAVIGKAIGQHLTGLVGAGSRAGSGLAGRIAGVGRGINALGHAEVGGKTYDPVGAIRGGIGAIPGMLGNIKGGIAGGLGQALAGIKGLIGGIPALLGMLPALAGAFAAVAVPALLIAGLITVLVLAFTKYRAQVEAVAGVIGKALAPTISKIAGLFQHFGTQVAAAWNTAFKPGGPADRAMKMLIGDLPKIIPALQLVGAVFGAVVAVILGVLSGLVNGFISALPNIIGVFDGILRTVGAVSKFVIDIFSGPNGWKKIPADIQAIASGIWGIITNVFGMVAHFIGGFVQGIVGFFKWLWDTLVGHSIIPDMVNGILNWFGQLPGKALAFFKQLVTNITNTITTFATTILNTASTIGKNLITGIGNGISSLKNWLGGVLGGAISAAVRAIPGGSGMAHLLGIPGFALGTMNAPGGFAMVGENGPELMYVPQGSQVYPHGQGPAQGPQQGSNTFWETRLIQSLRESRYGPTQPVTQRDLLRQLDPQYRYSYAYTA